MITLLLWKKVVVIKKWLDLTIKVDMVLKKKSKRLFPNNLEDSSPLQESATILFSDICF